MKILAVFSVASFLLAHTPAFCVDITADNLTVQQNATVAGSAGFGTVHSGLGSAATVSPGFRFSIAQASEEVAFEFTRSSWVEGYYHDVTTTVYQYELVLTGHWVAIYNYQVIGQNVIPAQYDEFGNEVSPGYTEDIWGDAHIRDDWVEDWVNQVVGSTTETTPVWVDGYTNTWVETGTGLQYGAPRLETTATRSDANWVWRVPGATAGEYKDVLVVWDGGLRIPSADPNRMMAMSADSLTQSITYQGNGFAGTIYTKTGAEEIKANHLIVDTNGTEEESTSQMRPEHLSLTKQVRNNGVANTVQTQVGASYAHFGGVVQVEQNLNVRGVLRVLPAGDLDMGAFTNGNQP